MLELEVIRRGPKRRQRAAPLVFVHGAYCGAWCWDEYFLPYFAAQGYDCHALSLRGHGSSAGRETLSFASLEDYVSDLAEVVATLDEVPIIIGHSMGGAIAQRYADTRPVAGLILLASVPPRGLWDAAVELWWRNPALLADMALVQSGREQWANLDRLRQALFGPDMPWDKARGYLARMQQESERALFDLSAMHWSARPAAADVPVRVIGGAHDGLFGVSAIEATARWYSVDALVLPNSGHTLMLDVGWRDAADPMLQWLAEIGVRA